MPDVEVTKAVLWRLVAAIAVVATAAKFCKARRDEKLYFEVATRRSPGDGR